MMPSWVAYCRSVAQSQKRHPNSNVRMSGIMVNERDARDTYAELCQAARYPEQIEPFEKITGMTAYGLDIKWTPDYHAWRE